MLLKEITYCDYPAGKTITPFQTVDGDNYFMEAGGTFTYLGSYEEIGNIRDPRTGDERSCKIMGNYVYVLDIFKRHSVIDQGKVIFTNPHFDDGHRIGESRLNDIRFAILTDRIQKYHVDSWGEKSKFKCFSIQDDSDRFNSTLHMKLFDSAKDAIAYAIKISKEQSMKCVVAQWFADLDLH